MSRGEGVSGPAERGFTLVEVIIALVVFAILATLLVTALGTSLTASSTPIFRLQQTMALHRAMENIRADFDASGDLAALNTAIGAAGTSQNNNFGVYEVVDNKYITFASYSEVAGVAGDGILKVSIKDQASGLVLTELFVAW